MGVSISEASNVDLNAIVAGGAAFMARIKALQQAKKDADDAVVALRLGMDIVTAQQDVQQRQADAVKLLEQTQAHVEKMLTDANAQAAAIQAGAQSDADALLAQATAQSAAIEQEVKTARAALALWSKNTRAAAASLLDQATNKMGQADAAMAANQKAADELARAQAAAEAAHAKAIATQSALDAKLEAIKAAAS